MQGRWKEKQRNLLFTLNLLLSSMWPCLSLRIYLFAAVAVAAAAVVVLFFFVHSFSTSFSLDSITLSIHIIAFHTILYVSLFFLVQFLIALNRICVCPCVFDCCCIFSKRSITSAATHIFCGNTDQFRPRKRNHYGREREKEMYKSILSV